ncbi:hypothetical protein C0Q59_18925 [Streptomyces albidoflavus]|nr:hypothetical protein C0Q59_18925 [Streptomyces albidoflavus]RZE76690.1 hypothetical protein C0R02_19920 [Streptomyces albidoflavus]
MIIFQIASFVVGGCLLFNVGDLAYRAYSFFMNNLPIGPGFGFSPFIVRVAGLGVMAASFAGIAEAFG